MGCQRFAFGNGFQQGWRMTGLPGLLFRLHPGNFIARKTGADNIGIISKNLVSTDMVVMKMTVYDYANGPFGQVFGHSPEFPGGTGVHKRIENHRFIAQVYDARIAYGFSILVVLNSSPNACSDFMEGEVHGFRRRFRFFPELTRCTLLQNYEDEKNG